MNAPWVVILNVNAGDGKAHKKWLKVEQLLVKTGIDFLVEGTKSIDQLSDVLANSLKVGKRRFVIAGGDGTLHYWVNALMNQKICSPDDITNALIPIGTGNDWFSSIYGKRSIKQIVKSMPLGKTQFVDIGKAHLNGEKGIYFVNMLSIGYSAHVVHSLQKKKVTSLGKFIYILEAIRSLSAYTAQESTVCYNQKCQMESWFAIQIGIGKYAGGGLILAPKADPTDGLFSVLLIPNLKKSRIVRNIWRLYHGSIHKLTEVILAKSQYFEVKSRLEPLPIESDGEFMGFGSVKIEVVPNGLKILTSS